MEEDTEPAYGSNEFREKTSS